MDGYSFQEGLNKKSHCYFFNIARPVESQVAPTKREDSSLPTLNDFQLKVSIPAVVSL